MLNLQLRVGSAPSWTDSSLISGLFAWVQEKAYIKSRWLLLWAWKIKVLQKAKMAFKQIDHIRSFLSIVFATTRTGKIMKTAMEISAAASIMNELESAYKWP